MTHNIGDVIAAKVFDWRQAKRLKAEQAKEIDTEFGIDNLKSDLQPLLEDYGRWEDAEGYAEIRSAATRVTLDRDIIDRASADLIILSTTLKVEIEWLQELPIEPERLETLIKLVDRINQDAVRISTARKVKTIAAYVAIK